MSSFTKPHLMLILTVFVCGKHDLLASCLHTCISTQDSAQAPHTPVSWGQFAEWLTMAAARRNTSLRMFYLVLRTVVDFTFWPEEHPLHRFKNLISELTPFKGLVTWRSQRRGGVCSSTLSARSSRWRGLGAQRLGEGRSCLAGGNSAARTPEGRSVW